MQSVDSSPQSKLGRMLSQSRTYPGLAMAGVVRLDGYFVVHGDRKFMSVASHCKDPA